jgi:hypothetical protein
LVEERKRLKSAATTSELAQQQEASIFPHASTGLGAVLNYEFLAKHNNSERRTASSSAKSRFLKSRGRSIGSDGLARTITSPEQHKSVVPNQGDTDLQLDHTTTLLQLRQHHQLATAHHQYQTLHPNNNDTPSVPHLYASTTSHNQVVDDQGHDLYAAYAFTVAQESKLRNLKLQEDSQMLDGLLTELREKITAHMKKANALLFDVVQSMSHPEDVAQGPHQELSKTYITKITKCFSKKSEARKYRTPGLDPRTISVLRSGLNHN